MAVAFLEVAKPLHNVEEVTSSVSSPKHDASASSNATTTSEDQKASALSNSLLQRYDRNGDGQLSKEEAPQIIRDYGGVASASA